MNKYNADNERIKRQYFAFLKEAKRQNESSVDAVAKAISRFETYNNFRDFKTFHFEQAVGFKHHLAKQPNQQTGKLISKATMHSALGQLKAFFQWLSMQQGYKSRIKYSDAEYFNLSEKDVRIATAKRPALVPTLEQVKHVIQSMPCHSVIEQRNRALIAFTLLTGARDSAIASIKLKHIDVVGKSVFQDAREVKTKFSKTFTTYFFPVGDEIEQVVQDWVSYLKTELLWGNEDPLFPKTRIAVSEERVFEVVGLEKAHWCNASPIRTIFRDAFETVGLPYFNPHSLRKTLVNLGQQLCQTPEEFKAWSQNLGHEQVMVTFYSYGEVQQYRQGEILQKLNNPRIEQVNNQTVDEIARAVLRVMKEQQNQPNTSS